MRGKAPLAFAAAAFLAGHALLGTLTAERARFAPKLARSTRAGAEVHALERLLGSVSYEARRVVANVLYMRLDAYVHEGPRTWIDSNQYATGIADNLDIVPLYSLITILDPHFIEAYSLAATHLEGGLDKPDVAAQVLREGIRENESEPRCKELHAQLASLLARVKKDDEGARAQLEKALALVDRHGEAATVPGDTYTPRVITGMLMAVCNRLGDMDAVAQLARRPFVLPSDHAAIAALVKRGLAPPTPPAGPRSRQQSGSHRGSPAGAHDHEAHEGHQHGAGDPCEQPPPPARTGEAPREPPDKHGRLWFERQRLASISAEIGFASGFACLLAFARAVWRRRRAALLPLTPLILLALPAPAAARPSIEAPAWLLDHFVQLFLLFVVTVAIVLVLVLNHLVRRGRRIELRGQDKLFSFVEEVLKSNPSDARFLEVAALSCDNGLHDRVLQYLNQITGTDPATRTRAGYLRTLALLALGRLEEAAAAHDGLPVDRLSSAEKYRIAMAWKEHNLLSRAKGLLLKVFLTDFTFADVSQQLQEIDAIEKKGEEGAAASVFGRIVSPRYRDLRVHGETRAEVVCLAFDRDLARTVRLRILKPEHTDEASVAAFLDEATRLSGVRHPAVVQVYDVQKDKVPYASTEDFEGKPLEEAVAGLQVAGRLKLALRLVAVTRDLAGPGKPLPSLPVDTLRVSADLMIRVARAPREPGPPEEQLGRALAVLLPAESAEPFVHQGLERIRAAIGDARGGAGVPGALLDSLAGELDTLLHFETLTVAERERTSLLAHLRWLDELHRSKVHSLKSKFAVCERYRDEPAKLVRAFFRAANVDEVCRMLASLAEMAGEVHRLPPCNHPAIPGLIRMLGEARLEETRAAFAGAPLGEQATSPGARLHVEAMVAELARAYERFKALSVAISQVVEQFELDLVRVVENAVSASTYGSQVRVDAAVGDGRVRVADAAEFRRELALALENLISNSFEAKASRVNIEIRRVESEHYSIHVRDDGCGVPDDLLERVRTARFTSKEGGTATGILSAKALVEKHRGRFEIRSRPGAPGTEVTLLIPAA